MTTMTEATQDILVHTEAGVTTITFNRVDKKNSITTRMYAAMADALAAAEADASVRAVVFQGDVAVFSAGNDIGDFLQQPPATQDSPVFRFLRGLAAFPKPVITAVCGPADVLKKIVEESHELVEARDSSDHAHLTEEFGDLLFVMANLARHLKIDPEEALRMANAKFTRRFQSIEAALAATGRRPEDSDLAEMDALWDEAKAAERT